MASVFSKIIAGELPGRFVWKDPRAVAFLTAAPLKPGHTLVVPRTEVDHWQDVEQGLMQHLMYVSQGVGQAVKEVFQAPRVGLLIAGLEVPHLHVHVSPIWSAQDLNFANVDADPLPENLDAAAEMLRGALRQMGFSEASD